MEHRRRSSTGRTSSGSAARPGIDLPGRRPKACCPTQQWRDQLYKEGETERPWSAGDNVQLATGQGDLQTNPLQMAIAYAAIANGGTVVTPHVGLEVDDAAGRVLKEFDPQARGATSRSTPTTGQTILEGLHDAAQNARRHLLRASSAASRSRSRARPAPRSGRATKTSPGTACSLRTRIRVSSPS